VRQAYLFLVVHQELRVVRQDQLLDVFLARRAADFADLQDRRVFHAPARVFEEQLEDRPDRRAEGLLSEEYLRVVHVEND